MGLFGKAKEAQQQARDAMANAGGAGGLGGLADSVKNMAAPGDMDEQIRYRDKAQKLKNAGIEAPAVIDTIAPGEAAPMSGSIDTVFAITINPPDGDAYATTVKQAMLPSALEEMSTGNAITVRFDPDDRSSALIYGW